MNIVAILMIIIMCIIALLLIIHIFYIEPRDFNNGYCKHCGTSIDSDSTFCKKCGKEQ